MFCKKARICLFYLLHAIPGNIYPPPDNSDTLSDFKESCTRNTTPKTLLFLSNRRKKSSERFAHLTAAHPAKAA